MRTDIHRPSVINPTDYQFVAFEYEPKTGDVLGDAFIMKANREAIKRHMAMTGGTYSRHAHGGNCHICGAWCIYSALFYHKPTNTYIRTGLDCAEKLDNSVDGSRFRAKVHDALEARAGKRKALAVLDQHNLTRAWEIYETPGNTVDEKGHFIYEEGTITEMVGKLIRFGSLSDKQFGFMHTLLDRIDNRAEIEAKREAEYEDAAPVPVTDDRITIRGKVLTIREPADYDQFPAYKMLVKTVEGFKVWGTVPKFQNDAGFVTDLKGQEIEFKARVKPSQDDPKFGYFNRPTQARVIKHEGGVEGRTN